VETEVAAVQVTNSNAGSNGVVAIEEANALDIEKIDQKGTGAVSIRTVNGPMVVEDSGIFATTGAVSLYAGGQTGSGFDLNAPIKTTGGGVSITADSGNITFRQGIEVTGNGNITLLAPQGAVLNDPAAVGWLLQDGAFSKEIEWALVNGKFSVNEETGQIVVAKAADYEQAAHLVNGTVLRTAEGPYIQTTGGALTIKA
jgi:hypothetical protein